MDITIIGVPADLGANRRGTDMGPSAVRYARLAQRLRALGHQVTDWGNVEVPVPETRTPGDDSRKYFEDISALWHDLAGIVHDQCRQGRLPLVLGGDHSLSVGTVAGAARCYKDIGVIWLDAHGDLNDPETSPTGNIHGMSLAAIIGTTTPDFLNALPEGLPLAPERTVIIGVRDLDQAERDKINSTPIHVFTMKDIDEHGIGEVVRRAWQLATGGGKGYTHISFDADVLDPAVAGGVGTPVPGGLTFREAHLAMEILADAGRFVSVEVSEINPILDTHNRTAELAVNLLESLMGKRIL